MDNPRVVQGDYSLLTEEDKVRWFRSLTPEERLRIFEQQMAWMRRNDPDLCKPKPPDWTDDWVILSLTDGIRYGPADPRSRSCGGQAPEQNPAAPRDGGR